MRTTQPRVSVLFLHHGYWLSLSPSWHREHFEPSKRGFDWKQCIVEGVPCDDPEWLVRCIELEMLITIQCQEDIEVPCTSCAIAGRL